MRGGLRDRVAAALARVVVAVFALAALAALVLAPVAAVALLWRAVAWAVGL